MMKEDLNYWFYGLDYEDEFGLDEVSYSETEKKRTHYAILSAVNRDDRKYFFDEDVVV